MTQISISEASRRWKISRTTVQNKVKSGALSLVQASAGSKSNAKYIDIAELIRVFGEPKKTSADSNTCTKTASEVKSVHDDNAELIKQFKAQIDQLTEQLEFANKQIENHMDDDTKLLEHQTKPLWKKLIGR